MNCAAVAHMLPAQSAHVTLVTSRERPRRASTSFRCAASVDRYLKMSITTIMLRWTRVRRFLATNSDYSHNRTVYMLHIARI